MTIPTTWPQDILLRQIDLHPNDPSLTLVRLLKITGVIDVDRLQKAITTVLRKDPGLAVQLTRTESGWTVHKGAHPDQGCRIRELCSDDPASEALTIAHDQQKVAIPVESAPLVTAELMLSSGSASYVLFRASHLVWDAQTGVLVADRIRCVYEDESPYADSLRWDDLSHFEPVVADADSLNSAAKFYALEFEQTPTFGHATLENLRDGEGRLPGQRREVIVGGNLARRVSEVIASHHIPASAFFIAISVLFQARITDEATVVFGCPVNTRSSQQACGYYVNTLPVKLVVGDDISFVELAKATQVGILESLRRRDVDYALTGVTPSLGSLASCFTFQGHEPSLSFTDAGLEPVCVPVEFISFPLSVVGSQFGDPEAPQFRCILELGKWADEFEACQAFTTLLEQVVSAPEAALGGVELVDRQPRAAILPDIVVPDVSSVSTFTELMHATVLAHGDKTALIQDGHRMSHAELDVASTKVASAIAARWPSARYVIVCHEWGIDEVIAMTAVIRSGRVNVPVDPDLISRIPAILDDLGAVPIIANAEMVGTLRTQGIDAVEFTELSGQQDVALNAPIITPEDPAYVIFTSGSTGSPKGVAVSHRALSTYILAWQKLVPCGPGEILLRCHHLAFDASVLDILVPLATGGAVFLAERDEVRNVQRFASVIADSRATCVLLTPSLAAQVMKFAPEQGFPNLRTTLLGAEAVPAAVAAGWKELTNPQSRVLNVYGPTEATVICIAGDIAEGDMTVKEGLAPLGTPLTNTDVAVVDSRLRRVPRGIPGELVVSGGSLAIGYVNRPELTRRCFLDDPGTLRGRWYRTGDRVRVRRDGRFEFLGRVDDQVKIGGFRVELSEVTNVLRKVSGASIVASFVDPARPTRLLSAVVTDDDGPVADWKTAMRRLLPAYMVPEQIMCVRCLPMNVNGKLDVATLSSEMATETAADRPVISDPTQASIHRAVSKVLGQSDFTCSENLFDVGLTSLDLTDLFDLLNEEYPEAELAIVDFFQNPTIEAMAARVASPECAQPSNDKSSSRKEVDRQNRRARESRRREERRREAATARRGGSVK